MKKDRQSEVRRPRRRCPKGCSVGIYHASVVFLVLGIIIALVAISIPNVLQAHIYDHRRPTRFLNVHILIGLFSSASKVYWLSGEADLENPLHVANANWIWARALVITGILLSFVACILHLLIYKCATNRKWSNILLELLCLLFAVGTFLAGLSLTEIQIQYLNEFGDDIFTNFLEANGLLQPSTELDEMNEFNPANTDRISTANSPDKAAPATGDFALSLSPPSSGFILLIVANSLQMLALLALLPHFVRLCERADKERRQLKKANVEENV